MGISGLNSAFCCGRAPIDIGYHHRLREYHCHCIHPAGLIRCLYRWRKLRASWPIISSVYPFFTSMFRRHSGVSFSDCEKNEVWLSQPIQRTGDIGTFREDAVRTPEGDTSVYGRFLHDEHSAMLNSAFPFTYLFEDVFLTPLLTDTTI